MTLASGSPRRKQLLTELGLDFEVMLRAMEENIPAEIEPQKAAEFLSRQKAAIYPDISQSSIVIAADTVVLFKGKLLGKPVSRAEAIGMISLLSGQEHEVITGVCFAYKHLIHSFSVQTKVFFRPLSTEQIAFYVDTYQPFDKAGAYGIQEWIGMVGIERIEGDYYNVVGLPVGKVYAELLKFTAEINN